MIRGAEGDGLWEFWGSAVDIPGSLHTQAAGVSSPSCLVALTWDCGALQEAAHFAPGS